MRTSYRFLLCFAVEALHLAHLMASHGYFFPIDDHMLTVKNDNTYYRFQVSPKLTRWKDPLPALQRQELLNCFAGADLNQSI